MAKARVGNLIKHPTHLDVNEEVFIKSVKKDCPFMWREFTSYRKVADSRVLFLRDGFDLIGWGFLHKVDDFYLQMYLLPGWRGRGHGKILVNAAEGIAKIAGKQLIQTSYAQDAARRRAGEDLIDYSLEDDPK